LVSRAGIKPAPAQIARLSGSILGYPKQSCNPARGDSLLFRGSGGVNPIQLLILAGRGNRMWLDARYFDPGIKPIGKLRVIVPERPDLSEEDLLLDAAPALGPGLLRQAAPVPGGGCGEAGGA
jgi:hypothetical protein